MNMQIVVRDGHTERFEAYTTESKEYGDHGVLLSLDGVEKFDVDDTGEITLVFSDGEEVSVPYGTISRGYDGGV